MESDIKSGYLYVLVHPSDPTLYKIGVTVLDPEQRLSQHNHQLEKYVGRIVKETGQKWELKTYIPVADPYWAERKFWAATPLADMPFLLGVEVQTMEWNWVQAGLDAAMAAGVRTRSLQKGKAVKNHDWMVNQLEGTGITMIERYRGLVTGMEFQCGKGHVFKESASVLASRKSCPCCVDWNWLSGPRKGIRASLR